jgi:5-formyltetrahydrofolate cyclo-ligase
MRPLIFPPRTSVLGARKAVERCLFNLQYNIIMSPRRLLRQHYRQLRRSLSPQQRRLRTRQLVRHLSRHPLFLRGQHIGVYLPNDGEPDLKYLIQKLWQRQHRCYLPVLHAHTPRLWFMPYHPHSRLRHNRFGIPEPQSTPAQRCPPWRLSWVLTPLVAFGMQGQRLGMGGGYYDRTFAYLHRRRHHRQPRLLGIAYALQQCDTLNAAHWDIPLWGIATENGVYPFPTQINITQKS